MIAGRKRGFGCTTSQATCRALRISSLTNSPARPSQFMGEPHGGDVAGGSSRSLRGDIAELGSAGSAPGRAVRRTGQQQAGAASRWAGAIGSLRGSPEDVRPEPGAGDQGQQ